MIMYILSMVCFRFNQIDAFFNSLSLSLKEGGRLALLCSHPG
jgi:hypothetical protein